jgi:hypothetical protein
MYYYQPHKRVKWEMRLKYYDAIYKIDNSIHVGHLLRILQRVPPEQDVVVPDVRYINEVQALVEAGFTVVRVTDGVGYKPVRMSGLASAAPGTVKLQEFYRRNAEAYSVSYSIVNEDLDKLRKSVDRVVDKERAKKAILVTEDETSSNILTSEPEVE